jgi:pseudaminic acid synthase
MEPHEFSQMVQDIRAVERAVGTISYEISKSEQTNITFRKSIFVVKDIKAGEALSENNIRVIRPGYGLAPKHYESMIGKKAVKDIEEGSPLDWSMIEI